jgi:hypothetical protein
MQPLRGVVVAADEVVEANDNLVDNPSPEAKERFQNCMHLLRLRLAVFHRLRTGKSDSRRAFPLGTSSLIARSVSASQ